MASMSTFLRGVHLSKCQNKNHNSARTSQTTDQYSRNSATSLLTLWSVPQTQHHMTATKPLCWCSFRFLLLDQLALILSLHVLQMGLQPPPLPLQPNPSRRVHFTQKCQHQCCDRHQHSCPSTTGSVCPETNTSYTCLPHVGCPMMPLFGRWRTFLPCHGASMRMYLLHMGYQPLRPDHFVIELNKANKAQLKKFLGTTAWRDGTPSCNSTQTWRPCQPRQTCVIVYPAWLQCVKKNLHEPHM